MLETSSEFAKFANQSATLLDLVQERALNQPDEVVYRFLGDGERESGSLTYQQLDTMARAIAAELQSLGATGERALLIYSFSDTLEFIVAFFGCVYAGTIAVTTYPPRPNQSLAGFQSRVSSSEARFILTTAALFNLAKKQLGEYPELANCSKVLTDQITSERASAPLRDRASKWVKPDLTPESLVFLQYTSGSTGNPKGVMVTHKNMLYNSEMIYRGFGHSRRSAGVIWLPLYHDMGLIGGVIQPLYGGFPVVLMSPMTFLQKPFLWLQAVSRYQATTSGGPNFAYDLCLRRVTDKQLATLDLSHWEVAFSGAEPVRAETLEKFAQKFAPCGFRPEAFYPCYGMAETTLLVSGGEKTAPPTIRYLDGAGLEENRIVPVAKDAPGSRAIVSCGHAWLDQKILIVDTETLTECPPDQVGEIWVSGSGVGMGYWNRPEETEKTFNAYLADSGEGPFLRTGDLGHLHNGELFVAGRFKEMMIIWGRNQYPQNIEATVEACHPSLRPGCGAAFSVEADGEERLVIAYEVERTFLRQLPVEEIVTAIRQAIAAEYVAEVYAIALLKTASLPKTSSGKIQRYLTKQQFLEGTLNVVAQWQLPKDEQGDILDVLSSTGG
ncbi:MULTISPECIES: fatty acyl-AMP ligase [Planktothricoides]|uniref:Fatty acyl-AMP ligase n=1 Tax=Planktothricoides raciborskii FACHB-1370 TaxID=2949576 RepID=A0ABR8E6X1_9CYAN|nr:MULTISPECIES: fatty acyl-AMP ligase [Planktothricoides]KOR38111.1 AMP-binding protein [Planktothricoides sp. SR001]MBD2542569.1 fatty acyl-AMP ligase [Planktothricoides raciborskii FACHB-1370]MBD2581027.1 fatty acyl-AMP ligase [Planktothricoides raciborskii FACHB-1261]